MALADYTLADIQAEIGSVAGDIKTLLETRATAGAAVLATYRIRTFRAAVDAALVAFGCDAMTPETDPSTPFNFSAGEKTIIQQVVGDGLDASGKTGWPRIYWQTVAQELLDAAALFPVPQHPEMDHDVYTDDDNGGVTLSAFSMNSVADSIKAQTDAIMDARCTTLRDALDAAIVAFGLAPRTDPYTFSTDGANALRQVALDHPDLFDWTLSNIDPFTLAAEELKAEFEAIYTDMPTPIGDNRSA